MNCLVKYYVLYDFTVQVGSVVRITSFHFRGLDYRSRLVCAIILIFINLWLRLLRIQQHVFASFYRVLGISE